MDVRTGRGNLCAASPTKLAVSSRKPLRSKMQRSCVAQQSSLSPSASMGRGLGLRGRFQAAAQAAALTLTLSSC